MTIRASILIGVSAMAAAWWWFVRCEHVCARADQDAQDLFQRGELLSTLSLIDKVDSRCSCTRFTSGDTPPQYAMAQVCLRQLLNEGRSTEVEQLLAHAHGPILSELATSAGS
jgi:hypothetical protein